jgi:hypothetical protein
VASSETTPSLRPFPDFLLLVVVMTSLPPVRAVALRGRFFEASLLSRRLFSFAEAARERARRYPPATVDGRPPRVGGAGSSPRAALGGS